MPLEILVVLALLLLSAFFSGEETAFLALSDVRLHTLQAAGDKHAITIIKLKENLRRLLSTLLLGQTFCDIASSSIATYVASAYFGSWAMGLVTGILTLAILVFANVIPKSLAAHNPERWTLGAAPVLWLVYRLFSPLVKIIDRFVGLFVQSSTAASFVSEDEIKSMAVMGMRAGTVEAAEKELIERVFLLNDITAEDVMTPREGIIMLDGNRGVQDVLAVINAAKFSRYPVFEGERNNVVGIVHIKDIYSRLTEQQDKPLGDIKVKEVAMPALFVPGTKRIDDLFREFQKHRVHMAIVVNEYGTLVGLVTLEDLIEELVGEISDETDVDEHTIKRVDKFTIVTIGDIEIQNVNRFFNANIPDDGHKTLSRAILERLGSIPVEGQKIQLTDNVTATIEQADRRHILKIRLAKKQEGGQPKEA